MIHILANEIEKSYILHEGGIFDCCVILLEECQAIGAEYVQRVVDSLNERFRDLHIFNACKFYFSIQ